MLKARETLVERLGLSLAGKRRSHPLRVCIDGPDGAGKSVLADDLAREVTARGRPVIRASIDGFHRPRADRLSRQGHSPEGYYRDSFDHSALKRVLLEPLGPGGDRSYRSSIFDHRSDLPTEERWATADPESMLIFDGVFLLRPELRLHWDVRLYLRVGWDEVLERVIERDQDWMGSRHEVRERYLSRYIPGQKLYLAEDEPEMFADWVIDNTILSHPRVLRFPEGSFSQHATGGLRDARRQSFMSVGDEYERVRPQYPVEAATWVVGHASKNVLDLGCGPGKLTSQIAHLGHYVVGVDPSETMLRGLRARGLPAVCGTAESIPAADASFGAVTAAQAFHWFNHERAIPEIRRVLCPGGYLGLLWNLRDESEGWVRALSEIIGSEDAMAATLGKPDRFEANIEALLGGSGLFRSVEHQTFVLEQELNEDDLVDLVRSRSYVAILPEDSKEELLTSVRRLCRGHTALAGRKNFTLPYKTRAFRTQAI